MRIKATSDLWWKNAVVYCLDVEMFYDHDGDGYGLQTLVHDTGLQIYLEHFDTAVVTINGQRIEPWSQTVSVQ